MILSDLIAPSSDMCSTVNYIYSCRHREQVIFRCNRLPRDHTPAELESCRARQSLIYGNWHTPIEELCHDCEEASRRARRRHRRRPQARALPTVAQSDSSSANAVRARPVAVKNAMAEDPNSIIDTMVNELIEQTDARRRNDFDFRRNDEPWMARLPQRAAEGVIRPLETNRLQNIGRPDDNLSHLTPTQIWRFWP